MGVPADSPLDVYNFNGGFGNEWLDVPARLYRKLHPGAELKMDGGQDLPKVLQPRFVQGNPPDVIGNVGLNTAGLVEQGQLASLEDLMTAPAFDTPGASVRDTLLPGMDNVGVFDGTRYSLPNGYGLTGIWFSQTLFTKNSWNYPQTWDEMYALCAEIQKAGIAPWTYQGKYPGYMWAPIMNVAERAGGLEVGKRIDNLEANAWQQEPLVEAAARFHELVTRGYLLSGTPGLTHTQAQTYWAQGKAAFIPCGAWLENEMGEIIPEGFNMAIRPAPMNGTGDELPFEACNGGPTGDFFVPSKGKNPRGGIEFLRLVLSKEAARDYTLKTKSLSVVANAAEGLDLSAGLASMNEMVKAAGNNVHQGWSFGAWYQDLQKEVDNATGAMLSGEIDAKGWATRIQAKADAIAKDGSITKYTR